MTESNDVTNIQDSATQTPSTTSESDSTVSESVRKEPASEGPHSAKHPRRILASLRHNPEDTPDDRFKNYEYESVAFYPLGYPSWAAYQNSDPTFRIYKRFGTLRNRILLYRQQELAKLEDQLNALDAEDNDKHNHRIRSLRRDTADVDSKRMELIDQIDAKLEHYDGLLERELRSGLMQKPRKQHFRSLVNYLWNRAPIVRSEMKFLKHRDDFVILTGQPESPLERTLDHLICIVPFAWFRRLFASEAQRNKIDDKIDRHTTLTSTEKIEQLARVIASLLAISLIGIPLYVLASKSFCDRTKIIVLLISLVLFPAAIQIAARPKNHDLFAASAAYCAVLSTFLATSNNFNLGQYQYQNPNNSTVYH